MIMTNPKTILKQIFGYNEFRGQQAHIIERTLAGKNSLIIMPTGSGKSLIYQIPALILPGLTIVISPLIALMKDQVDILVKKGIDAAYINSSLSRREREQSYRDVIAGKFSLLYVTPERFRKPEFLQVLRKRSVALLAVDEAHCISEWGHDFRPDYTRLREFRKTISDPPTLALTATATPAVQQDIIEQLGLSKNQTQIFHEGIKRPNLFVRVQEVWGEEEKLKQILTGLTQNPGNGIIYFVLIRDLIKMSERLRQNKISHLIYHGDLSSEQRKQVQNRFMTGENQLILATNAFGMGIDKENIRLVIHDQIPASLEAYYQEIGRAGRDDKHASCSLLYDEQDLNIQFDFLKWNNPSAGFYHRLYKLLLADIERVNAEGLEYLREQLSFKHRHDYRLETALGILDRYGVIEGELANRNLTLNASLPDRLQDQEYLDMKLKHEQQKLYQMVLYTKEKTCRKMFINKYFGLESDQRCGVCDLCHG